MEVICDYKNYSRIGTVTQDNLRELRAISGGHSVNFGSIYQMDTMIECMVETMWMRGCTPEAKKWCREFKEKLKHRKIPKSAILDVFNPAFCKCLTFADHRLDYELFSIMLL